MGKQNAAGQRRDLKLAEMNPHSRAFQKDLGERLLILQISWHLFLEAC